MLRRSPTTKQPDPAWQNKTGVTIDIRRLGIPTRAKGSARTQTENGRTIIALLEALRTADILDPRGKQEVTLNGAYLELTVSPTPGIGPEVHQSKIRDIYGRVMNYPLMFLANSSRPAKTRSPSAASFGSPSGSIEVEVWITF